MLEAVKRTGGDPPVLKGAGYNGVYTASAGVFFPAGFAPAGSFFQDLFRKLL